MDLHTNSATDVSVVEPTHKQAKGTIATASEVVTPVERRYVHLEGRAIVRPARDAGQDVLEVTFVDGNFQPLTGTSPLFVYKNGDGDLHLMCHHLHMIASLSEQGYTEKETTLKVVNPLLEGWADLEVAKGGAGMTPTGPPPPPPPK